MCQDCSSGMENKKALPIADGSFLARAGLERLSRDFVDPFSRQIMVCDVFNLSAPRIFQTPLEAARARHLPPSSSKYPRIGIGRRECCVVRTAVHWPISITIMKYRKYLPVAVVLSSQLSSLSSTCFAFHPPTSVPSGSRWRYSRTELSSIYYPETAIVDATPDLSTLRRADVPESPGGSRSLITISPPAKNVEVWAQLVPPKWQSGGGIDTSMNWKATQERPHNVADRWLTSMESGYSLAIPMKQRSILRNQLQESIETFTTFCMKYLGVDEVKGRLVSCRKSLPSECDEFHHDDSPVKWIQTFVGPGCEWIEGDYVQWDRKDLLGRRLKDTDRTLAPGWDSYVHTVNEGDAALLVGGRWNEFSPFRADPAVYRDPAPPAPWRGRVVLVMEPIVPKATVPKTGQHFFHRHFEQLRQNGFVPQNPTPQRTLTVLPADVIGFRVRK